MGAVSVPSPLPHTTKCGSGDLMQIPIFVGAMADIPFSTCSVSPQRLAGASLPFRKLRCRTTLGLPSARRWVITCKRGTPINSIVAGRAPISERHQGPHSIHKVYQPRCMDMRQCTINGTLLAAAPGIVAHLDDPETAANSQAGQIRIRANPKALHGAR